MSIRPSVCLSRVIFERWKTSFPMLRWRRNLTWTEGQSRKIHVWHQNVGPSICLFIRRNKMKKKFVPNMLQHYIYSARVYWWPHIEKRPLSRFRIFFPPFSDPKIKKGEWVHVLIFVTFRRYDLPIRDFHFVDGIHRVLKTVTHVPLFARRFVCWQ